MPITDRPTILSFPFRRHQHIHTHNQKNDKLLFGKIQKNIYRRQKVLLA